MITVARFGGMNRKASPFGLRMEEARLAVDCELRNGKITPARHPRYHESAPAGLNGLARFGGRNHFFKSRVVSALATNNADEEAAAQRRLLLAYAGAARKPAADATDKPQRQKFGPKQISASGDVYVLGCPRPTSKPTITTDAQNAPVDGDEPTPRVFYFSLVLPDGTESQLSPAAVAKNFVTGAEVRVSVPLGANNLAEVFPAANPDADPPLHGWDADDVKIRLYESGAEIVPVFFTEDKDGADISRKTPDADAAETIFVVQAGQARGLEAQFFGLKTEPPVSLRGIVMHPSRFAVGWDEGKVYFSAIDQFGVWPASWSLRIPDGEILAVAEHHGELWIFPKGAPPRVLRIDTPGQPQGLLTSEIRYHCAEGGSVVNLGEGGLVYAAREGLVSLPGGQLLTQNILDERNFTPPNLAFAFGDDFFGVFDKADGSGSQFIHLTARNYPAGMATLGYRSFSGLDDFCHCAEGGGLWILWEGSVYEWDAGQRGVATWRSGMFKSDGQDNSFAQFEVIASLDAGEGDDGWARASDIGGNPAFFPSADGEPVRLLGAFSRAPNAAGTEPPPFQPTGDVVLFETLAGIGPGDVSFKLMKDGDPSRDEVAFLPNAEEQQRGGATAQSTMAESIPLQDAQSVKWLEFEITTRLTVEGIGMSAGFRPLGAPLPPPHIPHPPPQDPMQPAARVGV